MEKQNGKQKYIDFAFVKEHADFLKVLGYYNLTPTRGRAGGQFTLLCPFHDDTNPSLKVTPEKNSFHCFGCGAKGNILDFVRYMEQCDLREAAETLGNICRIDLAPPRTAPVRRSRTVQSCPTRLAVGQAARRGPETTVETPRTLGTVQTTDQTETPLHEPPTGSRPYVVDDVVNPPLRFSLRLSAHPYLGKRVSQAIIKMFGLGFCKKGSMAGRIAIPIHDEEGQLVAYAGRWPGDEGWPEGEDKYKLPPGFQKHRVLFNLNRVLNENHLVIVEGYFGVFALAEAGIPAVALMGSSLSPEQVDLLKRAGVERISVLLDGDAPGRGAAATIVATLSREFFVRDVVLPDDMQPDDLSPDALRELLFPPSKVR